MSKLVNSKGEPTILKAGDSIHFDQTARCIVLHDETCRPIKWDSDNKREAQFIHTESDFFEFAFLLAETHGLIIRKHGDVCPHGWPIYVFTEE